jgi:hypothetical protein
MRAMHFVRVVGEYLLGGVLPFVFYFFEFFCKERLDAPHKRRAPAKRGCAEGERPERRKQSAMGSRVPA